jgi:hypothetical protein
MMTYSRRVTLLAGGGLILAATAAVAGSGVGGVFNLGTVNTVNARTELRGSTSTQELLVSNTSTAVASSAILGASNVGNGVTGVSGTRIGVRAQATRTTGANYGLYATTASANGLAAVFQNTSTTTNPQLGRGIRSYAAGASAALFSPTDGAAGGEFAGRNGVIGVAADPNGAGIVGHAGKGRFGVYADTAVANGYGGYFRNVSTTDATQGTGIRGLGAGAVGNEISPFYVIDGGGEFIGPAGVIGAARHHSGSGVVALQGNGAHAVLAFGDSRFTGSVQVDGNLIKPAGTFKIDHPQDPANKYLSHSFVESPDMKNVYDGIVTTDARGEAMVELPSYFEALNRDPRYQLTVIGSFADAQIARKAEDNRFVIRTSEPNVEVSWQVTGIRRDAYAVAHPVIVEEDKLLAERGRYLHPEEHGQPADLAIGHAQGPSQAASARPVAAADGG